MQSGSVKRKDSKDKSKLNQWQKNIFAAVRQNNEKFLYDLFEKRDLKLKDFEIKDELGNTPLYYAVANKFVETVRGLLKIGVDVNVKNEFGNTALHRALIC